MTSSTDKPAANGRALPRVVDSRLNSPDHRRPPERGNTIQLPVNRMPLNSMAVPIRRHSGQDGWIQYIGQNLNEAHKGIGTNTKDPSTSYWSTEP